MNKFGHLLVRVLLLVLLLAGFEATFSSSIGAVERTWDLLGEGDGRHWSDPLNWLPHGTPEPGDDLVFRELALFSHNVANDMVNDLPNVTVRSMHFAALNVTTTHWTVSGNELTVTGGLYADSFIYDEIVQINCPLLLTQKLYCFVGYSDEEEDGLRLMGGVDLNGNDLEVSTAGGGSVEIGCVISGKGNVKLKGTSSSSNRQFEFSHPLVNTFQGSLTVGNGPNQGRTHAYFNRPGGQVATDELVINDGSEVILLEANQIGDNARVSITGGGRLLLKDRPETIRDLMLSNGSADADPTLVDTGTAALTLREGIFSSVDNATRFPKIRGQLKLTLGNHPIHLEDPAQGPALDIEAQITGLGGFTKYGPGRLWLENNNSFIGPVTNREGIIELYNGGALGSDASGTVLRETGSLILRNVAVPGETLHVQGKLQVQPDFTGSLLQTFGTSVWSGPIVLETDLAVQGPSTVLNGPISGDGGMAFLFGVTELGGLDPNTYLGSTLVRCEQLLLNKHSFVRAFNGPLVVGGGAAKGPFEVRWLNVGQTADVQVLVYANGVVNLNGFNDDFSLLFFFGGRVETGAGTLFSLRPIVVNPSDSTAVISGHLLFAPGSDTEFIIGDGAAEPDLLIDGIVSGGNNLREVRKEGTGTMRLTGSNTYLGKTIVTDGILVAAQANALGAAGTTVVSSNATLRLESIDQMPEDIVLNGAGVDGTRGALEVVGGAVLNGRVILDGPSTINIAQNAALEINNEITGTGPLTKIGPGNLTFGGRVPNTYTGDTLVNRGTLLLSKPSTVAAVPGHLYIGSGRFNSSATVRQFSSFTIAGSVTVNRGGLWDLIRYAEDFTALGLQGHAPLTLVDGGSVQTGLGILYLPSGGDLVVSPGNFGSSTITGNIGLDPGVHHFLVSSKALPDGKPECTIQAVISQTSPIADVEKGGSGTLVLSGVNSYAGKTIISGGRLQIEGSQPQSLVQVQAGTLQGAGVVGPVLMTANSAAVAPHSAPSILTTGDFSAGPTGSGVLQIQLNGPTAGQDYDQLRVQGTVNLSNISLQATLTFNSAFNDRFTIIQNDGADPVMGTFTGLPQDASFLISGEHFQISYTSGDGNDVVLTHLSAVNPSASFWTNYLGGDWHVPTNWSNQSVPNGAGAAGNLPSAAITNFGFYTVTNNLNVLLDEFFYSNGGGLLRGPGNIDLRGPFTWQGGSFRDPGAIVAGAGIDIITAAHVGTKGLSAKTLINNGRAIWSGDGTITLSEGAVLSNMGGATFDCTGDGIMENGLGDNRVTNAGFFRKTGGTNTTRIDVPFDNTGTVEVQTGTLSFNGGTNSGPMLVFPDATLAIGGTQTFTPSSSLTGGGNLTLAGSAINLAGSVKITGDQTFSGGIVDIAGDYNCIDNTLTISGPVNLNSSGTVAPAAFNMVNFGRLTGSTPITVSGPMKWTGAAYISGSGDVTANGGLFISGNVSLDGRTLVNNGAALWTTAGSSVFTLLHGALFLNAPGATFDCAGAGILSSAGANSFVNRGLLRKASDTNEVRIDALVENTGEIEIATGLLRFGGGGRNFSTVHVAAHAGVSLSGGMYSLAPEASLTGDGDFRVDGATANLAGRIDLAGTHTYSGGVANITGEYNCIGNKLEITSGTANFNGSGTIAPATLTVGNFGKLAGANLVTVSGLTSLNPGATLAGNSGVVANGGLSIVGNVTVNGGRLVNNSAGSWNSVGNGRLTFIGGAVLFNAPGASFDLLSDGSIDNGPGGNAILNAGSFRKSAGVATITLSVPFVNTGLVEIQPGTLNLSIYSQNEGTTHLQGGNIISASPVRINGGILQGKGVISGSVINAGVLRPGKFTTGTVRGLSSSIPDDSHGEIIIAGDYTQTAEGALNIEISGSDADTGFDRLIVSDKVTLDGTLNVNFTNGFYPSVNSRFSFLVSSNHNGSFSTLNFPSSEVGLVLSSTVSNLNLQVVNTRPMIAPIADQIVTNFSTLQLTVTAADQDLPAQTLTYALTNSPIDATIDQRGKVTWKPALPRAGFTYNVTVLVTDNGTPNLTSSRTFAVRVVSSGAEPTFALLPIPGEDHSVALHFIGIPAAQYITQYKTNIPGVWLNLATNLAGGDGFWSVIDSDLTDARRFYRVFLVPR